MWDVFISVFDTAQFVPHGMCLLWRPDLLILHGGSDLLIALAYFAIPLIIIQAKKKRPDLIDPAVARMFAAFITACALSHTGALFTLWFPAYALQGIVKLMTAGVSIYTAIQLARIMPLFLSLPSREELIRKDAQIILGERKIQEAQEAQEKLSEFAHIASHDLKAPLRGISNQAKFIEMDHEDALAPQARKRLARISELCEQVETSITTLLQYSSIRTVSVPSSIDPRQAIEAVVDPMSEFLSENNASISIETDLPKLRSDPSQIEVVFRNLILNAIIYNTSNKKQIAIGHVRHANLDGQEIWDAYYVKDNGIGIAEEFQDAVFKMFKRLHSDAEFGPGTGSGLAFVKKVVGVTNGAVGFSSIIGEGSTFYVSFADQRQFEQNAAVSRSLTGAGLGHAT
ncbi:sensor histidine kinase [Roseobacter litoralis]|uniref:histidine kinase n=1 Tax=Roseobacter litoralis (strain ATCC 49566 / DSM 6996 / JCM 21268 / NBRC 15278 / OCh 149) TaxID=391595 RepID=F7ZIN2_ROSLO|nr:ATP-binding protein [Roseobacter litoralis]AEI93751.1 sensor transduction histidine kinase [Roseobacter litoralis Och 149]